ncbi:MAG: hypothetical protein L3K26_16235, partial [Candidatus Hydrogenedentes bacterium]|nr:hypothetical protein [Candidatus Hydrogenedentota bacterium]
MASQPFLAAAQPTSDNAQPVDIGSRRELFVDRVLIESLSSGAQQRLHHPVPREVALEHDASWEGTGCGDPNV